MLSSTDSMWFRIEPKAEFLDEIFDLDTNYKLDTFEVLDNVPFGDFFTLADYQLEAMKDKNHDPCLSSALDDNIKSEFSWAGFTTQNKGIKHAGLPSQSTPMNPPKPFVPKNHQPNQRSLLISSIKRQQQQQMKYIRHDHSFSKQPIALEEAKLKFETPEGSSEDDNSMDELPSQYQQVLDFITTQKQEAIQLLSDLAQEELDTDLSDYLHGSIDIDDRMECDVKQEEETEESSSSESSEDDDDEESVPVMHKQFNMPFQDHAYHKPLEADTTFMNGRNKTRLENMGVDTPSDSGCDSSPNIDRMTDYETRQSQSVYLRRMANNRRGTTKLRYDENEEEEIDVVNIGGDAASMQNSRVHFKIPMPTNPSPLDRKSIQKTVATAIRRRQRQTPSKPTTTQYTRVTPLQQNNTIEHQLSPPLTPTGKIRKKRGPQADTNTTTAAATVAAATPTTKGRRPRQNTRQRRKRGNGESDSDSSESEKRNQHNNMERQRRVDLRQLFNNLRLSVPVLREKERAAKVHILREAKNLVKLLMAEDEQYREQKEQLKRHQDMLMRRVSNLRRVLASKR